MDSPKMMILTFTNPLNCCALVPLSQINLVSLSSSGIIGTIWDRPLANVWYIGKIWDGLQNVKFPIVWDFPHIWKPGLIIYYCYYLWFTIPYSLLAFCHVLSRGWKFNNWSAINVWCLWIKKSWLCCLCKYKIYLTKKNVYIKIVDYVKYKVLYCIVCYAPINVKPAGGGGA